MKKSGIAFHCHHDRLFEYVYDYDKRVRFIKGHKPKSERKLRLKLFKMIPEEKLPHNKLDAYYKAEDAYYKAGDAYWYEAWDTYYKARAACNKAEDAYYKANKAALEALHKELCPNCPWDRKTIFSGGK